MAAALETAAGEEVAGLVAPSDQEVAPPRTKRLGRRGVIVASVGFCAASAAVLWKTLDPCGTSRVKLPEGSHMMGLYEEIPQDLLRVAEEQDWDAVRKWLEKATEPKVGAEKDGEMSPELHDMIKSMMAEDDPKKARLIVDKAMAGSVERAKERRKELKKFVESNKATAKGNVKGWIDDFFDWFDYDRDGHHRHHNKAEQKGIASCFFDVMSATTSVASFAANMNDAAKTCWGIKPEDFFNFNMHGPQAVHSNVCVLNAFATLGALVSLSSVLSSSADSCASTLIPNVDALCANSITGLVSAVAAAGGAATLVKSACHRKGWYHDIPKGLVPSNVGNNEYYFLEHGMYEKAAEARKKRNYGVPRHLEEADAQDAPGGELDPSEKKSAPARKLLFGGGKGSTATQCATMIANTMWALAAAGMAIEGAAKKGGSCPPVNLLTRKQWPKKSILYKIPQALCIVDVTGALWGFLTAITFVELAFLLCSDTMNLGLICGAGITGLMSAASGLAKASSGVYLACDVTQKEPIKKLIELGRKVDKTTNGLISDLLGGSLRMPNIPAVLGRRLQERGYDEEDIKYISLFKAYADAEIEELKKQFKSPHEVFRRWGAELDDKDAPWRNFTVDVGREHFEHLTSLFKEQKEKMGVMENLGMCPNTK